MSAIKNYYHEEIVNRGYDSIDEWWNMMDEDQEYIEEQSSDEEEVE